MLTAIMSACFIVAIILAVIDERKDTYSGVRSTIKAIALIVGTLGLIFDLILGALVFSTAHIDEKIEMYETENARIEMQMADTVNAYLEHESELHGMVAERITPESSISIVAAFPELNSSDIVAKQIEVYKSNNDEMKLLRQDKIDAKVYKFLVYFGGGN